VEEFKWKQWAGVVGLFVLAVGLLYYSFTWTEEVRMDLSDAKMTGKVLYKGKPVPYALVILANDNASSSGNADAYGNYTVLNVPVGELRIGVNTAAGRGMMTGALMAAAYSKDKSPKPTFIDVPAKFFDPDTSGITTKVAGKKDVIEFDIDIK
jgi:hypothetical protein